MIQENVLYQALTFPIKLLGAGNIDQQGHEMKALTRITFDPQVMGGKPCIRGMRVTVGMIVGMFASGHTKETVLGLYPYLEPEDVDEALSYAAWRVEEIEVPVISAST
jgi:uncharacterized protein (DUF433 family)